MKMPETLLEAVTYFADPKVAHDALVSLRWPNGVECPKCGATEGVYLLSTRLLFKCRGCKKQFSAKAGTVFEDSPLSLSRWLPAVWLIANCKNGISSYELGRALKVGQKTAWFMLHRIRLAMQSKSFGKMGGTVEVDETFIGGKARFMHKEKKERVIRGRTGMVGKVAVMGLLERHGRDGVSRVRVKVVPGRKRHHLDSEVRANVEEGAHVYSDALPSYNKLGDSYVHKVIDHAERYADGVVHTNGLENFWSLLKRSIKGTYVSVEPFHLGRYIDEQARRFNDRNLTDGQRFAKVLGHVAGRRLTYAALTGAQEVAT
jgi:transposase-like protein